MKNGYNNNDGLENKWESNQVLHSYFYTVFLIGA